jgi:protein-L-isoaspartate(D-aspartate) O-methyltransferase
MFYRKHQGKIVTAPDNEQQRQELIDLLRQQLQALSEDLELDDTALEKTLNVMASVPRLNFVSAGMRHLAYANQALPIGYDQTISQPFIVALMTAALNLKSADRVLEIGTGCGYQTAILSHLCSHVFSIELVAELQAEAKNTLGDLGITNVTYRVGDGHKGWPDASPFDAILVAAAADAIPPDLISQLAVGGRMTLPVDQTVGQMLVCISKSGDGVIEQKNLLPVRFVPLLDDTAGERKS